MVDSTGAGDAFRIRICVGLMKGKSIEGSLEDGKKQASMLLSILAQKRLGQFMKIFVTRPIPGSALEELKKIHEVEIWSGPGAIPRDILLQKVSGASAVIPMLTEKIDQEFFDAAGPNLKLSPIMPSVLTI